MKYYYICDKYKSIQNGLQNYKCKKISNKVKGDCTQVREAWFADAAAKELGFASNAEPYVKFAVDEDNPSILYLINVKEGDEDSFRVNKAGNYYYVNTRLMFDSLQIDYINETVIYDMIKVEGIENDVYRMNKRTTKRAEKEDKDM